MLPALKRLEGHALVLGIVSHRTLAAIQCSLRRHGLVHHFHVRVSPQVTAAPRGNLDLAMWEYALRVVGARAIGLLPILIDRDDLYAYPDCWKAKDVLEPVEILGL